MPWSSRSRNINLSAFNAQLASLSFNPQSTPEVDACNDNLNFTESKPLNPDAADWEPTRKPTGKTIRGVPARPAMDGQGYTNQVPLAGLESNGRLLELTNGQGHTNQVASAGPESSHRLVELTDAESTNGQGCPTRFPIMGSDFLLPPPGLMEMSTVKREELLRRLPLITVDSLHMPSELEEVVHVPHTENNGHANVFQNANEKATVHKPVNSQNSQNLRSIAEICNDAASRISSMQSQLTDLARNIKLILDDISHKEFREWLAKKKHKETHVLDRENVEDLTEQPCLQPTKLAPHTSSSGGETPQSLRSASTNGGNDCHGLREFDILQYDGEESKELESQVNVSSLDEGVYPAGTTSLKIEQVKLAQRDDTDAGSKTPPELVAGPNFLDFLPKSQDISQPHSPVSPVDLDESQSLVPAIDVGQSQSPLSALQIGQIQSPILAVTQTAPRAMMPRGSFKLDIVDKESDSPSSSDNDDGLLTPIARYINNKNQAQAQIDAQTGPHPIVPSTDIGEISFGECTREEYITTGYYTFNVVYNPSPQIPREVLSRRVTISNLPKGIDISEVLSQVRGGPIEWTSLVDTTFCGAGMTLFVSFLAGGDAKRFVDWASEAKLEFHGAPAVVRLTPTPSYPLSNLTALRLHEVQESRSLRITHLEEEDMDTIVEELCGTGIPSHHVESTVQARGEMLINFTSITSARAVHYRVWYGDYLFESEHVPDPCVRQDAN